MELSEIIKEYRAIHNISMDRFAGDCGISKSYVSMIENEKNPQSGKPVVPSITVLRKLAKGMGIDVNCLISRMDDHLVDISEDRECDEKMLLAYFKALNPDGKNRALEYVKLLAESTSFAKDMESLEDQAI